MAIPWRPSGVVPGLQGCRGQGLDRRHAHVHMCVHSSSDMLPYVCASVAYTMDTPWGRMLKGSLGNKQQMSWGQPGRCQATGRMFAEPAAFGMDNGVAGSVWGRFSEDFVFLSVIGAFSLIKKKNGLLQIDRIHRNSKRSSHLCILKLKLHAVGADIAKYGVFFKIS